MKFNRSALAATCLAAALGFSATASAEMTKMVGGAAMYPSKNIIQNAVNSKDNTTLVAAVKAAGLVDTLEGAGPFTVFAPTNKAFNKLPTGTVENLLKPENKGALTGVLTYHVLPGHITGKDLASAIKQGGGEATFKSVQGEPLVFSEKGKAFEITDSKGRTARIIIADVMQSNGVIHVIDEVLLP
ncbi:fasciclin domain-containing protein [Methylocella silvestris]|uniref:Fasciclin n=1 Tax=Methylocella silvestris TaxID=199596 RepID=A0A2J7TI38_METSI|nr:fasciclin [Methylocella silvestris]